MRVLFGSYHNYLDFSSGAAISTRSTLKALAQNGWKISVFNGPAFDATRFGVDPLQVIARQINSSITVQRLKTTLDGQSISFRFAKFNDSGIDATVFLPDEPQRRVSNNPIALTKLFFHAFSQRIQEVSPEIFCTYGGDPRIVKLAQEARKRGTKTVFHLHNLAYRDRVLFDAFDAIVVPSTFAQKHYQNKLGVDSVVIPPLVEEDSVLVSQNAKRYITFVNPSIEKGRYFFIGLANELGKLRPEIPFLLVESRDTTDSLKKSTTARLLTNLYRIDSTSEPRNFYELTKILLVPSLCEESFGRVVVEAGVNGIPALYSNRGALPEVCGIPQTILPIPNRFHACANFVPTEEETRPWVEIILRLWDNENYATEIGSKLRRHILQYSNSIVEAQTLDFYRRLV